LVAKKNLKKNLIKRNFKINMKIHENCGGVSDIYGKKKEDKFN
jgi:hypothetical protein